MSESAGTNFAGADLAHCHSVDCEVRRIRALCQGSHILGQRDRKTSLVALVRPALRGGRFSRPWSQGFVRSCGLHPGLVSCSPSGRPYTRECSASGRMEGQTSKRVLRDAQDDKFVGEWRMAGRGSVSPTSPDLKAVWRYGAPGTGLCAGTSGRRGA